MLTMITSHSRHQDPEKAALDLVEQCQAGLGGRKPTAGLFFSSYKLEHRRMLDIIGRHFPALALAGCATQGEVSPALGYRTDSNVLAVFVADRVRIVAGVARDLALGQDQENQRVIRQAVQALRGREAPALGLIFPDGVGLDGARIVAQFQDALGSQTALFGSAAADGWSLTGTHQFYRTEVLHQAVPFLLFFGPLQLSYGLALGLGSNGWVGVGEKAVAEVENLRIKRIDGQPALAFFQSRFKLRDGLLSVCHPLAVYEHKSDPQHYFRDVIAYDETEGSVQLMQALPKRVWVQMTQPVPEAILATARQTVLRAFADYHSFGSAPPAAALWFSCASRVLVLNQREGEEFSNSVAVIQGLPPLCGFYGYGEIGPGRQGGNSIYHSTSLIILLIGETPEQKVDRSQCYNDASEALLLSEIERLTEDKARLEQALATLDRQNKALKQQLAEMHRQNRSPDHDATTQAIANQLLAFSLLLKHLDRRGGVSASAWFKGKERKLNRSAIVRSILKECELSGREYPVSEDTLYRYLEELMR